jgi:hypothetical protein
VCAGESTSRLGTTSDLSVILPKCSLGDSNVTQSFMFTQEQYESPLVKKLRELEVRILFACLVIREDGTRKLGMFCFP